MLTWSSISEVFDSAEINTDYVSPSITQNESGGIIIAANKINTYLELSTKSPGWYTTNSLSPDNLWLDSSNGFLYLSSFSSQVGAKRFLGTCRIDIETWTIDKLYGYDTLPCVAPFFNSVNCYNMWARVS